MWSERQRYYRKERGNGRIKIGIRDHTRVHIHTITCQHAFKDSCNGSFMTPEVPPSIILQYYSVLSLTTDYVRTFTLDKRLEMYIKKTAGRVLPTVVYPELYRKRFCEAIERYFTVVPDKWTYLGADI